MNHFDNLVKRLKEEGYEVSVINREVVIVTENLIIGFSDNISSINRLSKKICFDNAKCFDKWSKCPYSFPIPETEEQFQYILSKLKYLETEEGFKASDNYQISEHNYPNSLK